jgi:hypothetical protein
VGNGKINNNFKKLPAVPPEAFFIRLALYPIPGKFGMSG